MKKQHHLKLQEKPFLLIKSGQKTVEMRLYDEKRRNIKIGDEIVFRNINTDEEIITRVLKYELYANFAALYQNISPRLLGYKKGEIAKPSDMYKYYQEADEIKHGVVALYIRTMFDK